MSADVGFDGRLYAGKKVYNRHVKKTMHMVARYICGGVVEGIYSDAFDIFVKTLAKRIENDQQNVVVVEGDTGSGKSAFGLNLCVSLAKYMGKSFDLANDYIYSADDLWQKLSDEDASPISILDEGSVTIASANATRKDDKDIATLFNTMRSRGWTTIICNPSIMRLNSAIRTDHVDFKIRCNPPEKPLIRNKKYGRGFFQCRKAVRQEFRKSNAEPYWQMQYTGVFGDYPPSLRDEYLEIKNAHQDLLLDKMVMRARTEEAQNRAKAEKYLGTGIPSWAKD